MKFGLRARVTAEFMGTAFLVAAVVGSGVMGERLAGGNVAIALLANTIATGAALVALILTFGSISGAHFNPAVTVADAMERGLPCQKLFFYIVAQCAGGIGGAIIAHLMFGLTWYSLSTQARHGWALVFSEFVATFGLLSGWPLLWFLWDNTRPMSVRLSTSIMSRMNGCISWLANLWRKLEASASVWGLAIPCYCQ